MNHSRARRSGAPLRALIVTAVAALIGSVLVVAPTSAAPAQASSLPASILEGGFIISDAEFFASGSMSAGDIQNFLNGKVPACRATSGPACLKDFRSTVVAKAADKYCAAIPGGSNVRASDVISLVSTACGINPKVILVMLQKEQGLVTSTAPSNWNIQQAMGQACPDTPAGCDPAFSGFFNQVYYGARQLQVYTKNPNSFNYRAGQVNTIQWHPNASCGTSKVYIQNQATANLYIYTPYRANVASLAAGYGTGDNCSTYGNRNFYNYYVDWFAPGTASSTGAPAQVPACTVPAEAEIAARTGTATVNTASLNARTAPTMHCTSGMTSLSQGTSVTITGEYGMWTRATRGSSTFWVATSYLTKAATPAPGGSGNACAVPAESSIAAASGTVTVATGLLNARQAPSVACSTGVVSLRLGDTATRTGVYGDWWQISRNGATYWIHSDFASVAGAPAPAPTPTPTPTPTPAETLETTDALNLRSGPATTSSIIVVLAKGTKVSATEKNGAWRKVTVGSRTGWVHSDFLRAPGATSTPAPAPAPAPATVRTSAALNLRESASTSSRVIATIPKDTAVTVTGANGVWRSVTVGGRSGWMHADFLVSTSTTRTTTAPLNLRPSNNVNGGVIVVIPQGASVTVTGTKGGWTSVTYGSRSGWVSSAYLR